MARRLALRVLGELSRTPTLAVMQGRLGGPREPGDHEAAGRVVSLEFSTGGERRDGVATALLFETATTAHVWVGDGRVKRVPKESVSLFEGVVPEAIACVVRDLLAFHALVAGDRVTFRGPSGAAEAGTLVAPCRLGALVARPDGTVVGVGFRRLTIARSMGAY